MKWTVLLQQCFILYWEGYVHAEWDNNGKLINDNVNTTADPNYGYDYFGYCHPRARIELIFTLEQEIDCCKVIQMKSNKLPYVNNCLFNR